MGVELGRLGRGDRLAAVGALALLAFMFLLDWFGEGVEGSLTGRQLSGVATTATGWEAFTGSRWVWLATVVVALASALAAASGRRLRRPVRASELVTLLGAVSSVLIVYRIVHHPGAKEGFGGLHVSSGIRAGIWLGLVAAVAIAAGGYLQTRAEEAERANPGDGGDAQPFTGVTRDSAPYNRRP
jgi:hypothetical protein